MNRLHSAVFGAAMGLAAACSTGETAPKPEEFSVTVPGIPEPSESLPLVTSAGENTRRLLSLDASMKIIYVPVTNPGELNNVSSSDVNHKQFLSRSRMYIDGVKQEIVDATHGRYQPQTINIVEAPVLEVGSECLDTSSEAATKLYDHASPVIDDTQVNVLIVNQEACDFFVGGFARPDTVPILSNHAFSQLGRTIMHEVGHSAGLLHAGRTVCAEPTDILACQTSETTDPNSIMGYESGAHFTGPDLYELGLHTSSEVLENPSDGEYILHDAAATDASLKTLIINRDGQRLYISWEPDSQAGADSLCAPEQSGAVDYNPDDFISSGRRGGEEEYYLCLKTNHRDMTNTLQTRLRVRDSLSLVTRPDRAPDPFGDEPSSGEITPGTVVYKDKHRQVTFVGFNQTNQAIVGVETL